MQEKGDLNMGIGFTGILSIQCDILRSLCRNSKMLS